MKNIFKKIIIQAIIIYLFMLIINSLLSYIDTQSNYDMEELMILFALFLGLIYHIFGIGAYFIQKNYSKFNYLCKIAQPSFLVSCFSWYFYLYVSKIFSITKDDSQYFQSLMIAFSLFFLTVKIGKEVVTLLKAFNEN